MGTIWFYSTAMNQETNNILNRHEEDLNRINDQRRLWLYASSVVFVSTIFLIFGWNWLSGLESSELWWFIVSCMLITSINWWYWTMKVIRIILKYQAIEYELLKDILNDVAELKASITTLKHRELDKLK